MDRQGKPELRLRKSKLKVDKLTARSKNSYITDTVIYEEEESKNSSTKIHRGYGKKVAILVDIIAEEFVLSSMFLFVIRSLCHLLNVIDGTESYSILDNIFKKNISVSSVFFILSPLLFISMTMYKFYYNIKSLIKGTFKPGRFILLDTFFHCSCFLVMLCSYFEGISKTLREESFPPELIGFVSSYLTFTGNLFMAIIIIIGVDFLLSFCLSERTTDISSDILTLIRTLLLNLSALSLVCFIGLNSYHLWYNVWYVFFYFPPLIVSCARYTVRPKIGKDGLFCQ